MDKDDHSREDAPESNGNLDDGAHNDGGDAVTSDNLIS